MTLSSNIRENLCRAIVRVCEELESWQRQSPRWQTLSESALWRELVSCILGSGVPYEQACAVVHRLRLAGLLDIKRSKDDPERFESEVARILSRPIPSSGGPSPKRRYRFPLSRANHLRRTIESIYARGASLREILSSAPDVREARVRIISSAVGAGPKQASLFLRNIGYAADLAVLDRHVLQYMKLMELTASGESGIQSVKKYEELENTFRTHAHEMGFSVADFDIGVWVAMRVFRREIRA